MIDLYTAGTSNGYKVSVMLEELGLAYEVHPIDLGKDEQFEPWFVEINPNSKIPAIVDREGPGGAPISVFESAAILVYLAQKTGSPLLPSEPRRFTEVMKWLFFQMANVGPLFGQMNHFVRIAEERMPYPIQRYTNEAKRILGVLDRRLAENPFLAGEDYSIADIATHPWVRNCQLILSLEEWPHVRRWYGALNARPAVQRGILVPKPPITREACRIIHAL